MSEPKESDPRAQDIAEDIDEDGEEEEEEEEEEERTPQSRSAFLAKFKKAGFGDIDVHEAPDGQLLFELDSDAEHKLMAEFEAKLQEMRATGPERPGQKSPHYIQDASGEGVFWQRSCLRARKYDVDRGIELYLNYLDLRVHLGVDDPEDRDTKATHRLLETDFTRCCGNKDKCGRYVMSYDGGSFQPSQWTPRVCARAMHHVVVHAIARFPDLPVRGIVTIGDMQGWGYSNFDPETEKVISSQLTELVWVK